ncbi:class I SAM-dependent RNA methyltransferase [Paracoccus sp. (in: a-proteobacteria)]|uniref:class I SAM-dependent RNA methyltransferase n=1 Tax=Paracoccus sp. TaxID=267 RepID=UPI0026DF9E70|nr:class I SAM-dependent RNA methyltransferase [Paracoccus sp. (in: a-proteobacteria)]MDO5648751.1 class I SAM-dependent RNA methyltransferase [Paracoccus sp. (in: a-proteobacteria)]
MIWTIERLGRKGDGVAVAGDARALAAQTLPGEVIEGDVTDGRITAPKIITPSPDRVRAPCPHYRACGGCSLMHATDAFTAGWKRQVVETALTAQGLDAPIVGVHSSPLRSRRRAVLSGRRTKKGALVGFHGRASDVIVDLSDCLVMRPEITAALPLLRDIVAAGGSRAGEISLTVTHGPAGLDVAARGGKPMDAALFQVLAGLADTGDLARLDWDGQAITRRPPALPMGRAQVVPPPGAFLQATQPGQDALTAAIRDITQGARQIIDLFAGCGTFTLPLAETAAVTAVEGLAAPLAALDSGWRGAQGLNRVTTQVRDLARRPLLADEFTRFDAIVIDPPRAGAEPQMHQIAASRVPVVAAISCDPVTFARDARILVQAGYALKRVWVVDQFRFSPHVEIGAELTLC